MHMNERKTYESPTVQELGELRDITHAGDAFNSDAAPFPSDSNPSDAFGPLAS